MSTMREDIEEYLDSCESYGDEVDIQRLRSIIERYPQVVLCGKSELIKSHGGGNDYSAPCIQPTGPDGTHNGKHLNRNGESWND